MEKLGLIIGKALVSVLVIGVLIISVGLLLIFFGLVLIGIESVWNMVL